MYVYNAKFNEAKKLRIENRTKVLKMQARMRVLEKKMGITTLNTKNISPTKQQSSVKKVPVPRSVSIKKSIGKK